MVKRKAKKRKYTAKKSVKQTEKIGTASIDKLQKAKKQLEQTLLFNVTTQAFAATSGTAEYGFENIVGVGISEKITNGVFTGKECITVYVVSKESEDTISKEAFVPKKINDIPTDVVATGELRTFPHRGTYRPAPGGVSVGHYQITAGTLGCLVKRGSKTYILSNNHVLANVNKGKIGDAILQPGSYDGGEMPTHVIGHLSEFVPIQFGDVPNDVDCAIAEVKPNLVTAVSKCFGKIKSAPVVCHRFQVVKKCGRTTQLTRGIVTDCNATVRVGFGTEGTAIFQNQILVIGIPYIAPFSQPGDSGSLVITEFGSNPVGLLFAGSTTHTILNPISTVLSKLNVSIVA